MKRIEIMAKMREENVADEIITFLLSHSLAVKMLSLYETDKLDAIFGLAEYLGEEVEK